MKNTRKIIPALAMLIVAAVMLSSASYAWFTMSHAVEANTMKVNIVAPENLVISNTATGTFATKATADESATSIKPASSISGATGEFFDVVDNQILTDEFKSNETTVFEAVTEDTASQYYIDYTFWISTQYAATEDIDVKVLASSTGLGTTGFTCADDQKDTKSMRFAILDNDDAAVGVYTNADTYQTDGKAVSDLAETTNYKVLDSVDALVTGTGESSDTVATVPQGAVQDTNAQKVTIRVWCEGESANCSAAKIASVQNVTLTVIFGY